MTRKLNEYTFVAPYGASAAFDEDTLLTGDDPLCLLVDADGNALVEA